jgi:hypothetical protein
MARVVPGPPPGKEFEFVTKGDGDPVTMILRAPTNADRRAILTCPEALGENRFAFHEKLAKTFLVRIVDYRDPDLVPIVTAEDLIDRGEPAIFIELVAALTDLITLSPDAAKHYAGPCASSPQTIRHTDGTAANAGETDSMSSAIVDRRERIQVSATPSSGPA